MQLKNFIIREDIMRMEFLAEEVKINVKFLKDFPDLALLTSKLRHIKKNTIKKIDVWIALSLKYLRFIKILKPRWLETDWLKKKIRKEKEAENLQKIPYNYIELTFIFYKKAKEIFDHPDEIINLVEILFQIRLSKIWKGLKNIEKNVKLIKLHNVASIELYSLKNIISFLFHIFSCFVL
nr:DNA replication complex gins protein psf2 [Cryptomonas curvata]